MTTRVARPRRRLRFRGTMVIRNDRGLHTRPSTELVRCVIKFNSSVHLRYLDATVNAKSLLGILTLAACKGAKIAVEAEGEDAEQAVKTLLNLSEAKFNMKY